MKARHLSRRWRIEATSMAANGRWPEFPGAFPRGLAGIGDRPAQAEARRVFFFREEAT